MHIVIIFTIIQLVNVITSTIKSILTIKSSKEVAAISSAISYGFNVIVVKQIANIDNIWLLFIVTVITNLVGVYVSKLILDRLKKDQLWRISCTVLRSDLNNIMLDLKNENLEFLKFETNWEKCVAIDIFSKNKSESEKIKEIFSKYKVKYTISSNTKWL